MDRAQEQSEFPDEDGDGGVEGAGVCRSLSPFVNSPLNFATTRSRWDWGKDENRSDGVGRGQVQ